MPIFEHGDARLHYEVLGSGFPVLLIAPGGMRSAAPVWQAMSWNPLQALANDFQLIAMDQRNAGQSTAPITASDGWHTYTADQLALVDHLGIDNFAIAGMCIGGPYIAGLIQAAPERVTATVMLQPIGLDSNRQAFYEMFDAWREDIKADHPEADEQAFDSFRSNMYDTDFLFNTTREQARELATPTMVLMGDDLYHPESISRALAELLPNVTFIERWKDGDDLAAATSAISTFLAQHSPSG